MAYETRFQFRGSDKLKQQFSDACEQMKVSQNDVFLSLIELFLAQDQLTREAVVRRGAKVRVVVGKK